MPEVLQNSDCEGRLMCPMCECEEVAWAAPLGSLWHACCRACGWVFSFEREESDEAA
jgi:hypothetical protein